MSAALAKLSGPEGFQTLDLGELYFIGSRTFVERGLNYFRQYAVESLEWDRRSKRMTALVAGSLSSPYEVFLWVRDGKLEHECDCPSWDTYGGCKHAVAAGAAMFLAVQGKKVSGIELAEDYESSLRAGLGVAFSSDFAPKKPNSTEARPKTEFRVVEAYAYGGMRFRIKGAVPHDFLESVGVHLPNSYGFQGNREFFLGDLPKLLPRFLKKAAKAGIAVMMRVGDDEVALKAMVGGCRMSLDFDLVGDEVIRRRRFFDKKGKSLEVAELVAEQKLLVTMEGAVYVVKEGLHHEATGEEWKDRQSVECFNAVATKLQVRDLSESGLYRLLVNGVPIEPEACQLEAASMMLDCSIWENAANEPERLDFECFAEIGELRVNLRHQLGACLSPVLNAYSGGMLAAKRRVRALLDLIRRVLVDFDWSDQFELSAYQEDFPELLSVDYRNVVREMLTGLLNLLRVYGEEHHALAVDSESKRWRFYRFELRQLAMLIFSISDLETRRALHELHEGALGIRRGTSGLPVMRRLLSVAKSLDVRVHFNELPVRSEPLSISVDARTAGTDIDWFSLHPSIACGERSIDSKEWRKLIRGDLLLRDEDGALVMPEVDEDSEGGLAALAAILRIDRPVSTGPAAELAHVSSLQMLDWIALRNKGVQLSLPAEAEALFESLLGLERLPEFVMPEGLNAELREYQKEGCAWIDFLYQHHFGACLADDMGLGKTVQTIAFLTARFEKGLGQTGGAPVLIVLPPSLVFNWLDEWKRFAPAIRVQDCLNKGDWANAIGSAQVILSTYDRLRLDAAQLKEHRFEIVVFDEAHNLKNVTAARTKAAAKVERRFTLCLTGTPVENNASEYYSVLSTAVPGIFGSLKNFKEDFRTQPDRILGRARPFLLRRTKSKILKELPKKEEHELFLEMSPLQKEIYTRTVSEVREAVAEAYEDRPEQQAGIVALAAILRLRQVCVSPELLGKPMGEPAPKFAYMADKLEELQAEGNAALVFSQFLGGLDQMEAVAKERGINYLRMDGSTPVAERKDRVRAFQSSDGPSFFFISLKTGGVGLNLTRANYVFHLDPWWNPAVENQASDRAHRIGQTRSVFVQRLIMQHSIEARMLELKARKAELFRQLVETPGAKNAKAGLSRSDFEYLLED